MKLTKYENETTPLTSEGDIRASVFTYTLT